jgi:CRP/FNR family transcriptional regulator
MSGELLGLDGFSNNAYQSSSVALEDSEVCIINQSDIHKLSSSFQPLQYYLQKILSSEIVRENNLLMVISHLNAEDKILAFLLNLGQRFKQRHYAEDQLYLRMSREDLGSYLNLKIETISRAFKKLEMRGLLEVNHKYVKIKNPAQIKDHLWACNH